MSVNFSRNSKLLDSKYLEFFIPTVLTAMTTTMSIVVDSIIVGNIVGESGLAAVNLVMPLMMAYVSLAVCLGMGGATIISIAKGRLDGAKANNVFTVALLSMIFFSISLMLLQLAFMDEITNLLTTNPQLNPLVKDYIHYFICGTPFIVVTSGMVFCLRTDGWVKYASVILIVANVVNLVLDLVYMGYFKMGIAGSSLATTSGYGVGFLILSVYFFSKNKNLHLNLDYLIRPLKVLKETKKIAIAGAPATMSTVLMTIKLICLNTIILSIAGKSGVVAFSVCLSCLSLISMFIAGAAQTMMPIIGVLFGAKDIKGIAFIVKKAVIILLSANLIAVLLLECFPELVLGLFGVNNSADLAIGVPAVRIFALSLIGTSITYLSMYYYMTIGKKIIATTISICQGFLVVVPSAFILSKLIGVEGVWVSFIIAEIATIFVITLNYLWEKSKNNKYQNILLLEKEDALIDFTIPSDFTDLKTLSSHLSDFLQENNISTDIHGNINDIINKIVSSIKTNSYINKSSVIDIIVKLNAQRITLIFRDNGTSHNHEDTIKTKNQADDFNWKIEQSKVLGFNETIIST
ncbi:MAG: MATE family efflux transporter [Desulfotalea sp.]